MINSILSKKVAGFRKSLARTIEVVGMSSVGLNKSAGLIVIGDEMLKGQVQDTNSHYLTKHLHQKGIRVSRISVLPDDIDVIAAEVKTFTKTFDYVLTSGGIGPTHDDVTFEAVAQAFDCQCQHHPELVEICQAWFKKVDRSDPCFKLAFIPTKSKLNFGLDKKSGKKMLYPIVSVSNVFIFPGKTFRTRYILRLLLHILLILKLLKF